VSFKNAINNNTNEYDLKMLKACELYVENYQPLHYLDGDTLEMGIFNYIPDSINNYLIACAKNNDFRALKYSYAIILRQRKEIEGIVTTPLIENFIEFQPNGFVKLFIKAMGINKSENADSEPLFFFDLCDWAEKNKKFIVDFDYVKRYKKHIKSSDTTIIKNGKNLDKDTLKKHSVLTDYYDYQSEVDIYNASKNKIDTTTH